MEIFDFKRVSLIDSKSKKAYFAENCLIFYSMMIRPYE